MKQLYSVIARKFGFDPRYAQLVILVIILLAFVLVAGAPGMAASCVTC